MKIAENLGLRTIKAMIDAEAVELLVFQKFTRRHLKTSMREEETASARSTLRANGSVSMREPESSSLARASWACRHRACA